MHAPLLATLTAHTYGIEPDCIIMSALERYLRL